MPDQDPDIFQGMPTDEQEVLSQLIRAQSGTDEEYQRRLRQTVTTTPSMMAKTKLQEMFGPSWGESSKMQKTRRVLDIISQLTNPAMSPTERVKRESMKEYQATAPIAQREESAMSAVQRAQLAAQSAQRVAETKDQTARMLGLERIRTQDDLNKIKELLAQGKIAETMSIIDKNQSQARELDRRVPNLNEFNLSAYIESLPPEQRQAFMERFGNIEGILGLKGAMRGTGTSTTTSTTLPGGEYNTPQGKKIIPNVTTSTRTPSSPLGGPQNILQMMQGMAQGGAGAPGPMGPGLQAQPQIQGNILPGPAPSPRPMAPPVPSPAGPGPQAGAIPPGGAIPQTPFIDPRTGFRNLPLDWTKGESETASRTATIQERRDVHSIANILPQWVAAGKTGSFAGGPEGMFADFRSFGTVTPGAEAMFDRVFNKTMTREILPESGKAFSQREIDLIEQFVPKKMNSVRSLLNKTMALHYGLGTREYFETHNYTEAQINRIPGMADYMERAIHNIARKSEKAQQARHLGDPNWKNYLPTQQELDPQFPIKIAIAAARAKVPGGKVKKEEE